MTVTRLTGGLTPGVGGDPRTFPAIWNATADVIDAQGTAVSDLEDLNPVQFGTAVPSGGQVLAFSTAVSGYVPEDVFGGAVNGTAVYRFVETVYFTSSGTFTKADYPWLRAIRVKCQGAGGGGGGADSTIANEFVASGGGGGGGYAESFITDIAGLDASVTVTRGAGGAGGAAGVNAGSAGGNSSFGALVVGNGGAGSPGQTAQIFWITTGSGAGGSGTGDLVVEGGYGLKGNPVDRNGGYSGQGGSTMLGMGGDVRSAWQSSGAGFAGNLYGGGGSGAASTQNSTAKAGGAGANGIVIVELYA